MPLLWLFVPALSAFSPASSAAQERSPVLKDPSSQRSPFYLRVDRSTEVLFDAFMLTRKAGDGDPVSQHSLGLLYLQGIDFAPDTIRAAEWITRAANQDYLPAVYNLGILKFNGWGTPWDPFGAYRNFRRAGGGGLPEGMYMTGLLHTDNLVVRRDYREAYRWIRAAADSGNANAAEVLEEFQRAGILARLQREGGLDSLPGWTGDAGTSGTGGRTGTRDAPPRGTAPDSGGKTGATAAGRSTSPRAPAPAWAPVFIDFDTDTLADPDDSTLAAEAFRLGDSTMERTAGAGAPEALTLLGRRAERGAGVGPDRIGAALLYVAAIRNESRWAPLLLWRMASDGRFYDELAAAIGRGDTRASFVWAGLIARGLDARLTREQAASNLRRAAGRGMTDALLELASWYEAGSMVPRDQRAADSLLTVAAGAGSREADVRKAIGALRRGGAAATAIVDTLRAAERDGSLIAQAVIGRCYETGTGLPVDLPLAVAFYRKAAQRGSRVAYDALKALYDSRRPDEPEFSMEGDD